MRYLLLILTVISLTSCSTVATQSEDGRTLIMRGPGVSKFENGAEISRTRFFDFLGFLKSK